MGDSKSYQSMLQNAEKQAKNTAKEVEGASKRIENLGTSLMGFGARMKLFVTAPLVGLGVILAKTASDAEETGSKFSVTFSSVEKQANQMVRTLDQSYGLADITARKLMSDTGDLLSGFGFTQAAAADLSFRVQKLAVDLASFTNVEGGAERASQALTRGLLGEREMMKMLGIAILEKDVKERMAINAAKGLRYENERMAKAYATLDIAIEQSKNSVGDYARTSKSLANQSRELWEDIKDLRVEFGKLLVPIGSALVGAFRSAVASLREWSSGAKIAVLSIGGLVAAIGPTVFTAGSLIWSYKQLQPVIASATKAMWGFKAASLEIVAVIAAVVGAYYLIKKVAKDLAENINMETAVIENQTNIMKKRLDQMEQEIEFMEKRNKLLKEGRTQREEDAIESARKNVERAKVEFEEARKTERVGGWMTWGSGGTLHRTREQWKLIEERKKVLNEAYRSLVFQETHRTPDEAKASRDAMKEFQRMRFPFEVQQQYSDVEMAAINANRQDVWGKWQRDFGQQAWGMQQLMGAAGGTLASLFGGANQGLTASLGAMFWGNKPPVEMQPGRLGPRAATTLGSLEVGQRQAQMVSQIENARKQLIMEEKQWRTQELQLDEQRKHTDLLTNLGRLFTSILNNSTSTPGLAEAGLH